MNDTDGTNAGYTVICKTESLGVIKLRGVWSVFNIYPVEDL